MTLEELEKKLSEIADLHAKLKAQFDKLKAQNEAKPKPPHPRWKPSKSEEWYAIGTLGSIRRYRADIDSLALDWCDAVANVFRSEDDAKFVIERRRVLAEMREWAGAINDSWHIYYTSKEKKLCVGMRTIPHLLYGDLRFATEEDAKNCIKAVGEERLKKYYFMIPEDEEGE